MSRYTLTEEGRQTAIGVISSICHGYNLEQTAALNGLDDEDAVRILLMMILHDAEIIDANEFFDDVYEEEEE